MDIFDRAQALLVVGPTDMAHALLGRSVHRKWGRLHFKTKR
jgi:hypothetical protein